MGEGLGEGRVEGERERMGRQGGGRETRGWGGRVEVQREEEEGLGEGRVEVQRMGEAGWRYREEERGGVGPRRRS